MKLEKHHQGTTGFTLIEMLAAIVVAGILVAIAVPRFYALLPGIRVASAARQVATDLQLARMRAIAQRTPQTVAFDTATATYTFGADTRNLSVLYPGTTIKSLSAGAPTFTTVGGANATDITLSNNGVPDRVIRVNAAGRIFTQ